MIKKIINFSLKLGIVVALLTSILPNIFPNYWLIDIMSNFKLQIGIFLIVVLVLNLSTKKSKVITIISILLITWNLSFLYTLYFPSKLGVIHKQRGTTIVSINLLSSNNDSEKVINFIKDKNPDILILLEYNSKWEAFLSDITEQYTFKKRVLRNDNFGIGYFSKIASETSVLSFDSSKVPSIVARLKIDNNPIDIIATHPFPPMGKRNFDIRNAHFKNLEKKTKELSENLIIIGDLNTSSYSKHFKDLLLNTNLRDSRNGLGILPTWPTMFTTLNTTLDHALISKAIGVIDRGTGPNIGSDHLPIFMEFRIKE
ncbi:endonuclease/exonuclease/phosphatase family protein [Aureibaculum sp. A20]|uniref:Endonuclease/exonuclease/phosphatase family protein n=1 Tax=Aureibaculum flavum TaxID=2795986 RepID=A0ABS0WNE1_9FLAO|nr:endonuclease/exonuclease/phosphatase family protein [Aureibaculum flavum]MBJ2173464.1 endonuclease/exonuclease/phosphatase family protein [Aureibaculum flavum]